MQDRNEHARWKNIQYNRNKFTAQNLIHNTKINIQNKSKYTRKKYYTKWKKYTRQKEIVKTEINIQYGNKYTKWK